ncbi:MAG: cupin domain-containing protein [Pseudomonadota bacterium]
MKAFEAVFPAAMFAFASLVAPVSWAQGHADHIMVAPKDLKWADVPSLPPGAKIAVIQGPMNEAKPFTVRLKLPANYKIPAHSHPAIEHVTVISGTFNMGTGDKLDPKQTKALSAGSIAIMQPKTNHFAWTKTATIVQLHGMGPWGVTYVNPADDPRKK